MDTMTEVLLWILCGCVGLLLFAMGGALVVGGVVEGKKNVRCGCPIGIAMSCFLGITGLTIIGWSLIAVTAVIRSL
jgi:lipid-A-disaccharide synthase-like uncharacterized protein